MKLSDHRFSIASTICAQVCRAILRACTFFHARARGIAATPRAATATRIAPREPVCIRLNLHEVRARITAQARH